LNKQDTSKKEEAAQRVKLVKILQGQTFYRTKEKSTLDIKAMSAAEFDAWACTFVDSIVNVTREVWDAFARWKFINMLLGENVLVMEEQEDGTIVLTETEVFSSAPEVECSSEPTSQAS
jgi:hypothetical protein